MADLHVGQTKVSVTYFTQYSSEHLRQYVCPITVERDWVAYRNPSYPFESASKIEGRFNRSGEVAFYIASGDDCAKAEVPKFEERVRLAVSPTVFHAFDLVRFASEHGFENELVKSKAQGGWDICQSVSEFLTRTASITGVLYQSAAMHSQGLTGYCIALLPGREQNLPSSFFQKH